MVNRLGLLVAGFPALLAAAVPVLAGTVVGHVKVSNAADADRTVVYIEKARETDAAPKTVTLSQKGARFTPVLLPILKGTTVDLTNDDWLAHSTFSKSPPKPFDLGVYGKGQHRSVTFEKAGVIEIFCAIHPRMNGVVLVLQNRYFAKPAETGRYDLGEVPEGVYDLKVYRLGGQGSTRKITVTATGDTATDF